MLLGFSNSLNESWPKVDLDSFRSSVELELGFGFLGSDFIRTLRWMGMASSLIWTRLVLMTSQSICIMATWLAESENKCSRFSNIQLSKKNDSTEIILRSLKQSNFTAKRMDCESSRHWQSISATDKDAMLRTSDSRSPTATWHIKIEYWGILI